VSFLRVKRPNVLQTKQQTPSATGLQPKKLQNKPGGKIRGKGILTTRTETKGAVGSHVRG